MLFNKHKFKTIYFTLPVGLASVTFKDFLVYVPSGASIFARQILLKCNACTQTRLTLKYKQLIKTKRNCTAEVLSDMNSTFRCYHNWTNGCKQMLAADSLHAIINLVKARENNAYLIVSERSLFRQLSWYLVCEIFAKFWAIIDSSWGKIKWSVTGGSWHGTGDS